MPAANMIWEELSFELAYRLGEITLFTRRFRALGLRCHFLDLPPDPMSPAPPIERLGQRYEVIVTRSHPIAEALPSLATVDGALRYVPAQFVRFHTSLAGTFEEYLGKFGSKTRSTLRKKVKRFLDSSGDACMKSFSQPYQIAEFHRLARHVSARTYQEKLLDAGIPDSVDFVRELEELASRDAIRAYVLMLRGEPIAYLCCPAVGDVLIYKFLGYDPAHAALSPGTVLQFLAFDELFREGKFRVFDFTEGQGEHKKFFGTTGTLCATICYFSPTLNSWFWAGMHFGLDRLSSGLGGALNRVGLKRTVKRLIRRI